MGAAFLFVYWIPFEAGRHVRKLVAPLLEAVQIPCPPGEAKTQEWGEPLFTLLATATGIQEIDLGFVRRPGPYVYSGSN